MEETKKLQLDDLQKINGGNDGTENAASGGNGSTTPTPATGDNGGSDTTLPGITFKKK